MGGWLSSWWGGEEVEKEAKIVMVGLDNAGKSTILYKLVEQDERRRQSQTSAAADTASLQASLLSRFFVGYGSSSAPSTSSDAPQTVVNLAPTIGFQVEAVRCGSGGPILAVWDVGGQSRLRQMWPICYSGAAAAVFVVDAADMTDAQRLRDVRDALHSLLSAPELKGAPFLLLANKSDAPQAKPPHEVLNALALHATTTRPPSSSAAAGSEPVSYTASLAGYATIPSVPTSATPSSTTPPLLRGRRWWVQATCGLTGEGLEEGFRWLSDTLTTIDKQKQAQEDEVSTTRWS